MPRYVTGIRKRGNHYSPHERIQGLCGPGWGYQDENFIIREIEIGREQYLVNRGGLEVLLVAASHQGRKYLKTEPDGYAPDNLLALPECPSS
jgi:Protein of unknown function (DUF3892)